VRGFGSYIVPYLIVKDSLYADLTADPINLTPLQAQLFPLARATHNDQHKQGSIFLTLNGIQQSVYFSRLQYPDVLLKFVLLSIEYSKSIFESVDITEFSAKLVPSFFKTALTVGY
jgi:hypothetical protein